MNSKKISILILFSIFSVFPASGADTYVRFSEIEGAFKEHYSFSYRGLFRMYAYNLYFENAGENIEKSEATLIIDMSDNDLYNQIMQMYFSKKVIEEVAVFIDYGNRKVRIILFKNVTFKNLDNSIAQKRVDGDNKIKINDTFEITMDYTNYELNAVSIKIKFDVIEFGTRVNDDFEIEHGWDFTTNQAVQPYIYILENINAKVEQFEVHESKESNG